ncbi:MAG: (Fe-S)-binding protein [Planctomycetes bacterium]|nr:(Fe-S)-binding protein [Planctomycetota bacterium]
MRVGLFIPCYVDQFYPNVGIATVALLRGLGVDYGFPDAQTCCGQPMANTGCARDAGALAARMPGVFRDFTHVVCPSGSCTAMVRHHGAELVADRAEFEALAAKTFELCEFLVDVMGVDRPKGRFPFRVGMHASCHGLRELRLGSSSERRDAPFDKVRTLLEGLDAIEFAELERPDECCGFGGTFAVHEESVSCRMGRDRLGDHERARVDVIAAADMSCLMHLEGLARRGKLAMRFMHVAEILVEGGALPRRAG